jgi:hypothetical protein
MLIYLCMYVCVCACMYVCMYVCEGYLGQIARDVPFRAIQLPSYELTKKWYSSLVAFRPLR